MQVWVNVTFRVELPWQTPLNFLIVQKQSSGAAAHAHPADYHWKQLQPTAPAPSFGTQSCVNPHAEDLFDKRNKRQTQNKAEQSKGKTKSSEEWDKRSDLDEFI